MAEWPCLVYIHYIQLDTWILDRTRRESIALLSVQSQKEKEKKNNISFLFFGFLVFSRVQFTTVRHSTLHRNFSLALFMWPRPKKTRPVEIHLWKTRKGHTRRRTKEKRQIVISLVILSQGIYISMSSLLTSPLGSYKSLVDCHSCFWFIVWVDGEREREA